MQSERSTTELYPRRLGCRERMSLFIIMTRIRDARAVIDRHVSCVTIETLFLKKEGCVCSPLFAESRPAYC